MCSHHLKEGDGADEVVVIVMQGLLHALANSFEPSKVNHSFKPATTIGVLCVSQKQKKSEPSKNQQHFSSGLALNGKKISTRVLSCAVNKWKVVVVHCFPAGQELTQFNYSTPKQIQAKQQIRQAGKAHS
jgi:hypothetical protein